MRELVWFGAFFFEREGGSPGLVHYDVIRDVANVGSRYRARGTGVHSGAWRQAGSHLGGAMSTIPVGDSEIFVMSPEQFNALMGEDRKASCLAPASLLSTNLPWNRTVPFQTRPSSPLSVHPDPIYPALNPLRTIDEANDWLKDKTYVDIFGWKDAITDGRSAVKQVMLLGIMGDAYLARTRAGKEAIIFRGRPGLRARLSGTRYLREHPIVREAGFVIGRKEMLEEAGKATKIAVVCFVAWDIVHELLQDKPDMTRLGISIVSDIFQAVAATYIGLAAGIFMAGIGFPVIVSFCFFAGGSFAAGFAFSWLDKQYGLTDKAVALAKRIEASRPMHGFVKFAENLGKPYVNSHAAPISYMVY
ncbi:hypothetical protein [Brytella acorum]|uniref:Uncharacterized protein n=1 Tax=Brytella acorum TaxID=2959299 RepID=A0AA35XX94_9PROT|nr:hypothetical protein [Brytella acorum]MDF3625732.1 hypothetical protein [Brytella acorum]CAI9121677.1 hypothetical protein LMG32879_002526 [Brytella acorum]